MFLNFIYFCAMAVYLTRRVKGFAGKPAPQTANLVFSVVLQQDAQPDPKT